MSVHPVKIRTIELNSDITFNKTEQQAIRHLIGIDIPGSKKNAARKDRNCVRNRKIRNLHSLNDRQYRELFPDLGNLTA